MFQDKYSGWPKVVKFSSVDEFIENHKGYVLRDHLGSLVNNAIVQASTDINKMFIDREEFDLDSLDVVVTLDPYIGDQGDIMVYEASIAPSTKSGIVNVRTAPNGVEVSFNYEVTVRITFQNKATRYLLDMEAIGINKVSVDELYASR